MINNINYTVSDCPFDKFGQTQMQEGLGKLNYLDLHSKSPGPKAPPENDLRYLDLAQKAIAEKKFLEESCTICLEQLGKTWTTTPCVHLFHQDCLAKWIALSNDPECPLCRAKLNQPSGAENDLYSSDSELSDGGWYHDPIGDFSDDESDDEFGEPISFAIDDEMDDSSGPVVSKIRQVFSNGPAVACAVVGTTALTAGSIFLKGYLAGQCYKEVCAMACTEPDNLTQLLANVVGLSSSCMKICQTVNMCWN